MAYTPLKLDGIEVINLLNKDGEQTLELTGDQGIVVSGKIQGTELEGTSLDINGSADISGSLAGLNGSLTTTANYFQLNTPSGYIQIGAMNTSHAHIYTDRASFYTNKPILVSGDTVLTSASGVMLSGNQTISGTKSFTGDVYLGNSMTDTVNVHGHLGIGDDSYPKIAYPGQNALWGGSGSTTGQIVIDLPGTLNNYDMMYMEIDIYEYSSTGATKLIVGGHNWNSSGNSNTSTTQWYNVNVQVIGALDKPVYFGRRNDGTSERRCIAIGETTSTWSYATVHVHKVHGAEFYSTAIDWVGDWNIAQTTSTSYFTKNPTTNFNSGTTLETNGSISASNLSGTNTGDQTLPTDFVSAANGGTFAGSVNVHGNVSLTGAATTSNQSRTIHFTGFDKEGTTDFSDAAYIRHTTNVGGHSGSVLQISSQNDAADGIAFTTNASAPLKWNSHEIWTAGNDGSGSGLDADTLDGQHASAFLTSLPSHNHDDRYYTETEMKDFARRGYIESQSAGNLATGWYTIAQNSGDRAFGEFQIWDTASSRHQSIIFNAAHHFGMDDSNSVTVLGNSSYSTDVFRYIRIKENGTYDGAAIQVYIDNATNGVNVAIIGGNAQTGGWALVDWLADSSSPSLISNWSGATEKTKIDLDNIHSGGIVTTGEIYAGGQTSQKKVFHTGNFTDSSSNWNTAHGWGNHASAGYLTSFDITTQTDSKYLRSNAADTASHRVVFSGCDTNNHDTIATGAGSLGSIEIFNNGSGNDAFMTFHVGGDYACYFGLDGGTNKLSVGGWSMGANSYEIYHSGNKPSLSTLGFTGATNANYITNNNQLTNGAGYITSSSLSGYATTSSTVDKANGLAEVGYGTDEMTFQQLSSSFAGYTGGWANYFIGNHGNGSNYYNTVHIMPFWGTPQYSRLEGNTLKGPFNYITDEKDTTTNYTLGASKFQQHNNSGRYLIPSGTSLLETINLYGSAPLSLTSRYGGYGDICGYGGRMLGYSRGAAGATLGVNKVGQVFEYEKIFTFKVTGSGWVNRATNPYKVLQAPGTDKMIIVDEFLVYIDYETRTGIGNGAHVARSYEAAAYSVGFYENETGQSQNTAAHGIGGTFYTLGVMPGGFMNNTSDRAYYRDVPVHQSALIANRSLFWKTSRNCSSSNVPGGAHYIKIKYRVVDISEEFSNAGTDQTIGSSSYHGQYAYNADGGKAFNDSGQASNAC